MHLRGQARGAVDRGHRPGADRTDAPVGGPGRGGGTGPGAGPDGCGGGGAAGGRNSGGSESGRAERGRGSSRRHDHARPDAGPGRGVPLGRAGRSDGGLERPRVVPGADLRQDPDRRVSLQRSRMLGAVRSPRPAPDLSGSLETRRPHSRQGAGRRGSRRRSRGGVAGPAPGARRGVPCQGSARRCSVLAAARHPVGRALVHRPRGGLESDEAWRKTGGRPRRGPVHGAGTRARVCPVGALRGAGGARGFGEVDGVEEVEVKRRRG